MVSGSLMTDATLSLGENTERGGETSLHAAFCSRSVSLSLVERTYPQDDKKD